MTSKENIERLDNAIKEYLSEQCYMIWNSIRKDLEELEEYRKIMGTPIQDILKRLKISELLKNIITIKENKKYTSGPKYFVEIREDVILNDETKEIIKEWLEND